MPGREFDIVVSNGKAAGESNCEEAQELTSKLRRVESVVGGWRYCVKSVEKHSCRGALAELGGFDVDEC